MRTVLFILILGLTFPSVPLFGQEELVLTLEKSVRMALEKNEEVLKAKAELSATECALTEVRSEEYPNLGLTSQYQKAKDETTESSNYAATFWVDQLIFRFGEVPEALDVAIERVRRARLAYEAARRDVAESVRRIFYDLLLVKEEIKERETFIEQIEKKSERIKERKKKGIVLKINVLNVELQLAEQQMRRNDLLRSLELKSIELIHAIGADEMAESIISGELPEEEFDLGTCIQKALANHLDLQELSSEIKRQERIVKEVFWQHLPELSSSLRYRDASVILHQENRTWSTFLSMEKKLWKKKALGAEDPNKWEFAFSLDFPIFDGFRTKGRLQEEESRLSQLKTELIRKQKAIKLEVRSALKEVEAAKDKLEIQKKVVELNAERLRWMETLLETPLTSERYARYASITYDDVMAAREALTEAQRAYFQAKRALMLAKEALKRTMGVID